MFSFVASTAAAAHAVRLARSSGAAVWSRRRLTWKTSGGTVTEEEMNRMLQTPEFMNNMSSVLPGLDRIRICSLDVEAEKELLFPRTVYEALKNSANKNTATSHICSWIDPATEKVQFLTYDRFYEESHAITMALRELGIEPRDFAAVSWINSKEFLEAMFGTTSLNMVLQPLYPNLDAEAVKYVLKQGEPKIYLCDNESKALLIVDNASELSFLKTVVVGRGQPSRDLQTKAKAAGIEILGMDSLLKLGQNKNHSLSLPNPEDIFTLIYTSGTTGKPKGAIITHECIMRACQTIAKSVGPLKARPGELTFCYMPTGHIYEILFELSVLSEGGTPAFWRGDVRKLLDDMKIIRPHYAPMVPRIMNKIYDGVCEKLAESQIKRAIFTFCYNRKKKLLQRGVRKETIYDKIAFRKIRDLLGGRVNSIITSSAPLSPEVMEFFKVTFGCFISEVYGSTETLIVSGTSPYDHTGGHLGGPFPSVEVKLIDVPELGYYAKDNVGEICVRSPFTFRGYFKNQQATDDTLVDGWVVTGDVGRWSDRGTLLIFDRKKDIFKLSQGEYIAPEKIESVYGRLEHVANVFVEGRADQRFCVAVVVPEENLFRRWLKDHGFEAEAGQPLEEICSNIRVRKAYLEEMRNFGTAHDLGNLQQVRNVSLEVTPFTVESGLLTSTLKLKRNVAREHFVDSIDQLYKEGSLVDLNV